MTFNPDAGSSCHADTEADVAALAALRLTGCLAAFAFLGMVISPFDGSIGGMSSHARNHPKRLLHIILLGLLRRKKLRKFEHSGLGSDLPLQCSNN
jgi:hypothetical protein